MTDKLQKIREEVERLKSNLMYGACSSQIAMETRCKEEAYNEVLAILDSLQEEPVSKEIGDYDHKAVMESLCPQLKEEPTIPDIVDEHFDEMLGEEPVSEDLEIAANEWDAKASFTPFYMVLDDKGNPYGVRQDYTTHAESFKAGAKWQKQQDTKILESIITNGKDYPTLDSFLNTFKMMQYGKIKM